MRAILMHQTGGPEVLRPADVPEPVPAAGELLIRTEAIGTHFAETRMRAGTLPGFAPPLPRVPGFEVAGTVTAVGAGVDAALAGTRVIALAPGGSGYAELAAMPARDSTPVPDGVSAVDAIAVATPAAVALALLRAARLTGTERVLVEAAGGAVGGYLVQLAREHGAGTIVATAGTAAKRTFARELGADAAVDHRDPDWPARVAELTAENGAPRLDVVFESIGGASAGRLLDAMTAGSGRMLYYGTLSGEQPEITPNDLLVRGLSLLGCGAAPDVRGAWWDAVWAARLDVLDRLRAGRIRPLVAGTLPLEDAAEAHRRLEAGENIGKLVLVP